MAINSTLPLNQTISCPPYAFYIFGPTVDGCYDDFDLTLFLEQSVLSIIPSILLLIVAPLRIWQLYKTDVKTLPSLTYAAKAAAAAAFAALQLALLILWTSHDTERNRATVPAAILSFLDALVILSLSYVEHCRSIRPSAVLNIYLFLSLIFDIAQVRTLYLSDVENASIAPMLTATIVLKFIMLVLEARSKRSFLKQPYRSFPPEATSGPFSRSFFWWLNSLFFRGFRNFLLFDDLYSLDENLSAERLGERMQSTWDRRGRPERRYTLLWAAISCLRWPLISVFIPRAFLIAFNYAQPFLISRAITFTGQPEGPKSRTTAYGLIVTTGIIYLGIAISTVHYKHRLFRSITMLRGALISLIYNRSLNLPDSIYDESAALTLMSTDVDRIAASMEDIHEVWARFIEVSLGIYLLARQLGWVCAIPVIIVALCFVLNSLVARFIGQRQRIWVEAVQRRVSMTSSMLNSMKSIKMMGLAEKMSDIIQYQRIRELNLAKSYRWMIVWLNVIANVPSIFAPVVTFVGFAVQAKVRGSDSLNTVQAFTSLAIIALVSSPAAHLLASIPITASAMGSFDRIQQFLVTPSRLDQRHGHGLASAAPDLNVHHQKEEAIELRQMHGEAFQRQYTSAVFLEMANIRPASDCPVALHEISLYFRETSMTMILGPIGCGKSVLLKAVLGELPIDSGYISVASRRMAYCTQTPWLTNRSIVQSICGLTEGIAVDEQWYQTVLHACALDQEISQLPLGDQSIIGSRGLTLSGGQKQLIALARCIYARQDVIILDDVFSALDSKTEELVASRLFGQNGLLRKLKTTAILATHSIRHLHLADQIVVLSSDGTVIRQGTHEELKLETEFIGNILAKPPREEREIKHDLKDKTAKALVKGPSEEDEMDLTRRTGDMAIYRYYLRSIGLLSTLVFCGTTITFGFSLNFPQVWLMWWTSANGTDLGLYVSVYVALALCATTSSGVSLWEMLIEVAPKSAIKLHWILLDTVMKASQSFFAETDTGTTLNRFSQDMTLIDSTLPMAVLVVVTTFAECGAQVALISGGSSYMALTIPVCLIGIYVLQKFYLRTSRQLRLMDLEARSPLYSHFLETLEGLSTLRSFGWQLQLSELNIKYLDKSQRPYYLLYCIQRWLNLVLDLMVAALAVTVMALATHIRESTNGGSLGIALNNLLHFNQSLTSLVTHWTLLETSLGAIARLKAFEAKTPLEQQPAESAIPEPDWPAEGSVEFRDVTAKYKSGMLALRDVTLSISSGQKIGVCGRTGSGKSSLLLTLLRLLDIESGTISIDGIDLATLPREIVRSRLIAIPQDPFILAGSIRLNADPSGVIIDALIIDALAKVGLLDLVQARGGLDAEMQTQPFSQGEQQLFCLARALLRSSRILVLDEATSNVDRETDDVVQRLIREEFSHCTIITVAHRLETIMNVDVVVVMEEGRIVEFDTPSALLARDSRFKELYHA